jgi:hypothetical protein
MADSFADYGNCYNLKPSRMAVTHAGLRPAGIVHLIRARVASIRFCPQFDSRPFTARTLCAFAADSNILGASNVGRRADLALQIFGLCGLAILGQSSAAPRRFRAAGDRSAKPRVRANGAARATQRVTQKE